MPLPLLRFPFVALKVILNHMEDIELIKVSLCSKTAERILRACGKEELSFFDHGSYDSWNCLEAFELSFLEAKRAPGSVCTEFDLEIKVELGKTPRISVEYDDIIVMGYQFEIESIENIDEYIGFRRDLILNGTRVPIVLTEDYQEMYIFWDNTIDGLLFLLKCYNKNFSTVIYKLWYQEALDSADLRKFVDYTSSLNVNELTVAEDAEIPIEDYKYIVENSKLSDPEDRQTLFHSYFEHDEVIQLKNQINATKLEISSGNLLSFQYLLECGHTRVDVEGSNFTNDQIRIFMEQWMNEKFANLYSMRLGMSETIDFDIVLEGLPVCEKPKKWWRSRGESPRDFALVERDDGVIAMLRKINAKRFNMVVDRDFEELSEEEGEDAEEDEEDGEDETEDEEEEEEDGADGEEDAEVNDEENNSDEEEEEDETDE